MDFLFNKDLHQNNKIFRANDIFITARVIYKRMFFVTESVKSHCSLAGQIKLFWSVDWKHIFLLHFFELFGVSQVGVWSVNYLCRYFQIYKTHINQVTENTLTWVRIFTHCAIYFWDTMYSHSIELISEPNSF